MSSRSFRRRNSRRRRRPGGEPRPGSERPQGSQPERQDAETARRGDARGGDQRDPAGQAGRGPQGHGQHGRGQHGAPDAAGGRRPPDRSREAGLQRPEQPTVFPDCPVCNSSVRDLSSALTHKATGKPAHFECILKELRESNELLPQEKLCYLGGGCFGILEMRPPGGPSRFVIKKRIQYEEKDAQPEWKKILVYSL